MPVYLSLIILCLTLCGAWIFDEPLGLGSANPNPSPNLTLTLTRRVDLRRARRAHCAVARHALHCEPHVV